MHLNTPEFVIAAFGIRGRLLSDGLIRLLRHAVIRLHSSDHTEPVTDTSATSHLLRKPDSSPTDVESSLRARVFGCTRSPFRGTIEDMTDISPAEVPTVTLNSGRTIPQLGYGTFQIQPADTTDAVLAALEAGYRHIDTAQMYGNEAEVGQAVAQSGINRSDLFITSKLNNNNHLPDDARRSVDESLDKLDIDYLDLFLIHWPLPTRYDGDFVSTWKTMEEFAADGRSRSIGVSNFQVPHLQRLLDETGTAPAVDQVEVHPRHANGAVREFCREHGIAVEAWAPLAQGALLGDGTVRTVAERVGRTPAQVVLRWHIQRGDIVFPKSMNPERMRENFAVFDFELDGDEMVELAGLDRGEDGRVGPHPDTMDYV